MNNLCPSCGKVIKPFSMKLVRTDKQGRKAEELGMLHNCPHCDETLTRNKHGDELALSLAIVFLPFSIAFFGYAINKIYAIVFAIFIMLIISCYAFLHYKYKLKEWPRWMTLSEYIANREKQ